MDIPDIQGYRTDRKHYKSSEPLLELQGKLGVALYLLSLMAREHLLKRDNGGDTLWVRCDHVVNSLKLLLIISISIRIVPMQLTEV